MRKNTILHIVCLLSIISLAFGNPIHAQVNPTLGTITNTIYISPNGNDSNTGTINSPLATFGEALFHCPYGVNGATVHSEVVFLAGTYTITDEIRQPCWQYQNGNGYKAVSIRGIDKQSVVLDGSTATYLGGKFINLLGSGISVKDLTIKLATATDTSAHYAAVDFRSLVSPCSGYSSSDILVQNVSIQGCYDHGLNITEAQNILVDSVEVINANLININGSNEPGGWGSGIKTRLVDNVEIRNCTVSKCWGEGISNARSTNTYVHNNVISDNYSVNIYLDNVINGTYFENLCFATPNDDTYWRADFPASGFGVAAEYYADNDYGISEQVKIYNNIILNTQCLYLDDNRHSGEPAADGFYDIWFVHNTNIAWQGDLNANIRAVRIDLAGIAAGDFNLDNVYLYNNVFGIDANLSDPSGNGQIISGIASTLPSTLFYGYNIWASNPERYSFFNYPVDLQTDWVEPKAPQQASEQHLEFIAPNIYNNLTHQGQNFTFVTNDFYGNPRNGNRQVGALLPSSQIPAIDILLEEYCLTIYADSLTNLLEILGENEHYTIRILDSSDTIYETIDPTYSSIAYQIDQLPVGLFYLEITHNTNPSIHIKTILKFN